jgi:hypothetical protein
LPRFYFAHGRRQGILNFALSRKDLRLQGRKTAGEPQNQQGNGQQNAKN